MIFSTVSSSTLVTEVVNQASFYLIFLSLVSKKLLLLFSHIKSLSGV